MKILLEGAEAHEYLELRDKYETLTVELSALKAQTTMVNIIETIKEAKADLGTRIDRDTKFANDLEPKKPSFAKEHKDPEPVEPARYITGKWFDRETKLIAYAMDRPETENGRTFKTIVAKLGRSEGSVRAKLSDLGIEVRKGVLYNKGV